MEPMAMPAIAMAHILRVVADHPAAQAFDRPAVSDYPVGLLRIRHCER